MTKKANDKTGKREPPKFVYVLAADGSPLMPTQRLGKVRRMLKDGRATIERHDPFTIRLTYETPGFTQPVELCVDAGYTHIGVSVKSCAHEYVSEQRDLLSDEKERHDDRRAHRGNRRSRLRHRKPRFDNRKGSKKKGRLAPSVRNKAERHADLVAMWCGLLPVTDVFLELGTFDTAALAAVEEGRPVPEGEGYQKGERYGVETLRQAVFQRDGFRCQKCGKSGIADGAVLRAHHFLYWKGRHGDRVAELVTLCSECHTSQAHRVPVDQDGLLGWEPRKLARFEGAAFMNIVRWRVFDMVAERCPNVRLHVTWGAATNLARRDLGLPKTHANDAHAMGGLHPEDRCPTLLYRKRRRNNRVLQKFYDARYEDLRGPKDPKTGKRPVATGQELSSGRTCRNKEKSGEDLRPMRGRKLKKGRVSTRTRRYPLRPGDEVLLDGERRLVTGCQGYGRYVKLEGIAKSVRSDRLRTLRHQGGWTCQGAI